ncbi:MAG: SxtJ family membrane protein [Ignavibacteriaceae bacterium]|nr:SxtJ family membrane protein [Ignavibacteriaceae bacterium]MCU0413423.1 SxtJ family membrane protein [Ignavibacteriaceae bacterium]
MLKEEFKHIKEAKKDLRKFGLTVGTVLAVLGSLLFYFEKPSAIYFAVIGGLLILFGVLFPQLLKPLNRIWMSLAIILGFIMSRVILTILFYLVLTPIGILAKLVGKKFMTLKYDKSAETYWEKRSIIHKKQIDYERQF